MNFLLSKIVCAVLLILICASCNDMPSNTQNESIVKCLTNKKWDVNIYKYYNYTRPDSGWHEKYNLKRQMVFNPDGKFTNIYYCPELNNYQNTYGRWVLHDSNLLIVFRKDSEWKFQNQGDSVRILVGAKVYSKNYFLLGTVYRSEINFFTDIFLTSSNEIAKD